MPIRRWFVFTAAALIFSSARAQDARVTLDIEPQPIRLALQSFGEQSGLQVLFRSEGLAIDELTSRQVSGEFSAREALDRLLDKTGLRYEFVNPHTIRISAAATTTKKTSFNYPSTDIVPAVRSDSDSPASRAAEGHDNEQKLDEIIVTATKRAENIQTVPITITALSGKQLTQRGIVAVQDIERMSPGVTITEYGAAPASTTISIRGVNQLDSGDQQESPNALYIDGAYVSFQGAVGGALFDIERLEVLRGPQGTLFGRNATGGLVQIITRKPTDEFEGYIQGSYGSYNSANLEGAVGGPIADSLTGRISAAWNRHDGFYTNSSGPDLGDLDQLNARVQLQYKSDLGATNLINAFIGRDLPVAAGGYQLYPIAPNPANHGLAQDDSGALFVANCASLGYTVNAGATDCTGFVRDPSKNAWHIDTPFTRSFNRTLYGVTNTFEQTWPFVTLTSITNYTKLDRHYSEAIANSQLYYYGYSPSTDARQLSEEVRLSGRADRLEWVAGAYFLNIKGEYVRGVDLELGDAANSTRNRALLYTQNVYTYALFGQADYRLTDDLTLIAGLRGNLDKKEGAASGFCQDVTATGVVTDCNTGFTYGGEDSRGAWSGRLQLSYKPGAPALIYTGVNRGNKGAAELIGTGPPNGTESFKANLLQPEELTAYETGFKTSWLNSRLRLNGDVFYYNYHNQQAFKTVGSFGSLFNADARTYGAEFELAARPFPHTTIDANLAYLHGTVKDVSLPDGTLADQRPAFAPTISWNVTARQEVPTEVGIFFGQAQVAYTGAHYFSTVNEPATHADGSALVELHGGWMTGDERTTLDVSVNNLTNKVYPIFEYNNAATGGFGMVNYAPPRWIQVRLSQKF